MADDNQPPAVAAHLAHNLRFVRGQRGLTQQQLAKLCDLPRSTLAQMETGAANPTLVVMCRLAAALRLSIEELLAPPHAVNQHFPRGSLPQEVRNRVTIDKLLPDPIPGMEIDRITLPMGARMAGVPHPSGTREYLPCEAGSLTLWTQGERFELAPGDVLVFQGDRAHTYMNHGRAPATGFSVVTTVPQFSPRHKNE